LRSRCPGCARGGVNGPRADARTHSRLHLEKQSEGRRHTLGGVSRSNGHRSPIQALDHIAELAQTLAPLLEDAADAGTRRSPDELGFVGRHKGFKDSDPTGTVALDPTQAQMRGAVRPSAHLIYKAEEEMQEAAAVIANGYLRLDRAECIRVVEKRSAALGR